jgi:4-alpha-glucanotransferase
MKVLQFAFGDDDPDHIYLPHTYSENCVAYTGTHDNPTTRQWLEEMAGPDELERVREYLGVAGGTEILISSMIEKLMDSKARMTILPVQDLLMLPARARMNNPAETFGNWRWRCTPDEMGALPTDDLTDLTKRTQRTRA